MKKNIFKIAFLIITIGIIFAFVNTVYAQSKITLSATPSLLEKLTTEIASETARKKLVEKRGVIGFVDDVSGTQITLSDLNGNKKFVDVDELTKFSSDTAKSFGISDLTRGMFLGALGLYNKDSRRILARQIDQLSSFPKIIYGVISQIDKKNYEITIVSEENQKIIFEIDEITKTYSYSEGQTSKSGFSKMITPETAIAIGFPDKQDKNKILATRIILFPDINVNRKIDLTPILNPTSIPSSNSGTKKTTN